MKARNYIRLECRDLGKKKYKFYTLLVTEDLFGTWTLVREWGKIGSPGTIRTLPFPTKTQALEFFFKKKKEKLGRGYQ